MAIGYALTLVAELLAPSDRCGVLVRELRAPSAYREAVRSYLDGNREEAIRALGEIDDKEIERFVKQVDEPGKNLELSAVKNLEAEDVCFEAASLLEAELAMSLVVDSRWNRADFHFDAGWRLSSRIGSPRRERFQRDWLLAAGLFHHDRLFEGQDPQELFPRGIRFLQDAARRYRQDRQVLLSAGALLEFSGSVAPGDRDRLKEAQALYRQAIRVAPDDPEAQLRLGWILKKLGKTKEAEVSLRRVLELTSRNNLIYRSRMALGALAESAGRLKAATAEYEAAAEVEPDWQVAYLAWAEVLHRRGAHTRAREVLGQALEREGRLDRWWEYELGLVPLLDPLLSRLRAEVTK